MTASPRPAIDVLMEAKNGLMKRECVHGACQRVGFEYWELGQRVIAVAGQSESITEPTCRRKARALLLAAIEDCAG